MRLAVVSACAFALFASALPQEAASTPSSNTETATNTSITATGTPTSAAESCFYLASTDQGRDGWLYVGLTSGGFRTTISDTQTPFRLSDNGSLFTRNSRVSMGYTRLTHASALHPNVDFLYFTSDFSTQTLRCRIKSNQLHCDSTAQTNGTRSDLVYCSWKDNNVAQKIFAFNSGTVPANCNAATLNVVSCDDSA